MQIIRNAEKLVETLDLDGRRVLDVGCGPGAVARLMARHGARVVGLEISPQQLADAMAEPDESIRYVAGRGEALPFPDRGFDLVVLFNSLHHIPPAAMDPALAEAARVLVPGGHVYISEPVADGDFFHLMQPVDDETEVRALALAAIGRAGALGLRELRRETYLNPARYPDFEAFRHRITAINPERRAAFDRLDARLRADFAAYGERRDAGVWFQQPTRMHLLARA